MNGSKIDFKHIRTFNGSQQEAFEEFCCQLAYRYNDVPQNSKFSRYRGAGGDGGVECVWKLPNGEEWGWQAKYVFSLKDAKPLLDKSTKTALKIHPKLTRYFICLPFNLTGPTGRKGKSESEKFEEYKEEWKKLAEEKGMNVEFILWDATSLIDRLISLENASSRVNFWFDKTLLDENWFKNHIDKALKIAEPRYSPRLKVKVPIYRYFEAFGKTPFWGKEINQKTKDIKELFNRWNFALSTKQSKQNITPEIPKENIEEVKKLFNTLKEIEKIIANGKNKDTISQLKNLIKSAKKIAGTLKEQFKEEIEKKYGKGTANSVPFRQFMAEYMASLPTANYDLAKKTIEKLNELEEWTYLYRLMFEDTMLIVGPAGIGKTHAICDIALMRLERGLKSIVLFGEHFTDEEPWEQIRKLLGLPSVLSKDDILTALDIIGESTGYPVIIFIDALNETEPHNFWRRCLKPIIEDVKRYKWLKLCLSCRSTYLDVVVPEGLKVFQIEHRGFEDIEFEASVEFFNYYELSPPAVPLLQPEFSNPLFLKLFCETLKEVKDSNEKFFNELVPFSKLINYFLEGKENKISKSLNYNPNKKLVKKAVFELVEEMQRKKRKWLSYDEAEEICLKLWPYQERSKSLLETLIQENLLREDRIANQNVILFSFDKLGDFLLAQKFLDKIKTIQELRKAFQPNGLLYFSIENLNDNKGLLEALAILIPEKFNIELNEVIHGETNSSIISLIIESIRWRKPSSITETTKKLVMQALTNKETFVNSMDVVLSKSTHPEHPLNADWFHRITFQNSMSSRDTWLAPFLHSEYDQKRSVRRLIEWSFKVNPKDISPEVINLWVTILGWFLSASDRRVRDNATKAIIRLMEPHCNLWPEILNKFRYVDDDYILERLLAAAYGSLIRSRNVKALANVAKAVFEILFKDKENIPTNVMIRDYGRAILEMALEKHVLSANINPKDFRPPYNSKWSDSLPADKEIKDLENSFKKHENYRAIRQLIDSMQPEYTSLRGNWYGDFGRYIFQSVLDIWDTKDITIQHLSNLAVKIIFEEIGYDIDRHGNFDMYIIFKYGPGRARPSWAERIGKKYQWIALYRLIGMVSDNFKVKDESWRKPIHDFYGRELKDIDPTVLIRADLTSKKES